MKTDVQSFISDHIEPGVYNAVFAGRQGPVPGKHGGMVFWQFDVEIDENIYTVAGVSSTAFSHDDRCKAHKWAKTIDPAFTDESETWDDAQAVGNVVQITVIDYGRGENIASRVEKIEPCQAEPSEQE